MMLIIVNQAFSQVNQAIDTIIHDPRAKRILDKVSQRYDKFNTIRIYFEYQVFDNKDTTNRLKQKFDGWLYVKGKDKYKLIIPKVEIFSDGVKIYTLNKDAKELNITLYDPESDDILTPQKLLYIYQKGFKYSLRGELTFDTKQYKDGKIQPLKRTTYVIDLYPEKAKESDFSIIRLWIDKYNYQIVSVKYQGKNGIDQVVDILEEKDNINIPDQMFIFDPKRLPKDIEIIDLTDQ